MVLTPLPGACLHMYSSVSTELLTPHICCLVLFMWQCQFDVWHWVVRFWQHSNEFDISTCVYNSVTCWTVMTKLGQTGVHLLSNYTNFWNKLWSGGKQYSHMSSCKSVVWDWEWSYLVQLTTHAVGLISCSHSLSDDLISCSHSLSGGGGGGDFGGLSASLFII